MQKQTMSYGQHVRAIWTLGFPLIASNIAFFAIHMTDTIMLGWYDVQALAAVVIASTAFFITFIVGAGFAMAVTPLVAEAVEAGDDTQVRRVTRMGLWLSVIYGAVFTVPFFWAEPFFLAIGQTEAVANLGGEYLKIACFGMIPALILMTLKSFLAALEHTSIILWGTVAAAAMNVVVNYALIFGNWGAPELGIQGAAIASVLVQVVITLILLFYALKVLPQFDLMRNVLGSDWEVFGKVFRLGWPIGLTSLAEGGLFSASAVMMGWIGELELAAHGIAIQLASLTFMVHIGLSQAATVRAGRALGQRNELHLRRGGVAAMALSGVFALLTVLLFLTMAEHLVAFFVDPEEPAKAQLIAIGVVLLAMAALFQVVDAAQVMALGLLRGVQDTAVPMVMAAFSYWVIGLPASYILAFPMGFDEVGLWAGLVIGLSFAAVLLSWRFWKNSVHIS